MSSEVAQAAPPAAATPGAYADDPSSGLDRSQESSAEAQPASPSADDGPPPPMCEIPGQGFIASFFGPAEPEPEAPKATELATDGQWDVEALDAILARAAEIGLPEGVECSDYDSEEVLYTPLMKQIGRTQLAQVVFYYAKAKALAERSAEIGSGIATHRCSCLRCGDAVATALENGAHASCDPAGWGVKLNVKAAMWQGRNALAAWEASADAPIVWDIPCSAHPALQKMYELYAEQVASELQPVGPAWDWLLDRPNERKFSHCASASPLPSCPLPAAV